MPQTKLAKGVRRSTYKGQAVFRWNSIGANGEPTVKRTPITNGRPYEINEFGYPIGQSTFTIQKIV